MRSELAALFAVLLASQSFAQGAAINFRSDVTFETGDAWSYKGRKYRLFGVQSCIRGTAYHAPDGQQEDCGMRSVASLMALFSTGTIACQPVGATKERATFVVCAASIDRATVDVGTALISSGAAFAATLPSGTPVSTAYAVAELSAKENRSGLWAGSFDHPLSLLLNQP